MPGEVATRRLWSVCKALGVVLLDTEDTGMAETPPSEAFDLVVVRSPVSSLAPAEACPSVMVMGFPPAASGAPPWEGVQGPPAGSPWEIRDTLIFGRLEVLLPGRGLEGWWRFSWTLRSSFSASSVCSDEMGTKDGAEVRSSIIQNGPRDTDSTSTGMTVSYTKSDLKGNC